MASTVACSFLEWSDLQRRRHGVELASYRVVDHFIADRDAHPAYQRGVDLYLGPDLALEARLQSIHQLGELNIVERKGAEHLRIDCAFALVAKHLEQFLYLRRGFETPIGDQGAQQLLPLGTERVPGERGHHLDQLILRKAGGAEQRAHLRLL